MIRSHHHHGYPWPSLTTPRYRPLLRQVFWPTLRISTELLYVGFCWSSFLCPSMWRGPQEYLTYELIPTSPPPTLLVLHFDPSYGKLVCLATQMSSDRTKQICLLMTIYIIISSIIMSCWQHGYPWLTLATFPYRSSPLAGLLDYIPYPQIVAECMFVLVVLLLLGHMWGSIRVHHL